MIGAARGGLARASCEVGRSGVGFRVLRHTLFALWLLPGLSGCSENAVLELFPAGCADGCTTTGSGGATATSSTLTTDTGDTSTSTTTASTTSGGISCGTLAQRIRTLTLDLPTPATMSDEWNPVLLAPRADGSSLLAYREEDSTHLRVVSLDVNDTWQTTVFETTGEEVHALLAHDNGGALVFVREDPDIFSSEFCRGGAIGQPPCNSLELVRFDTNGAVVMSATLTDKVPVAQEGSLFMWWFEHTARLEFANNTYGVYFRSARTLPTSMGLMPRPGDTLRFVDASGNRLTQGWDFGCVPSWSVRIAYNGVWAAVCHGDTPNAHRVVILDGNEQRQLLLLEGVQPAYRALGGLSSVGADFWLSYLQRSDNDLEVRLARINSVPEVVYETVIEEAVDLDFNPNYVFRTFHAPLGADLLLGWHSNGRLVLARADAETGAILEGPLVTDAPIDHFVEFTPFPNGDVGWAYAAADGRVSVTRVLGCVTP